MTQASPTVEGRQKRFFRRAAAFGLTRRKNQFFPAFL
jgi:hypothetical protein